MPGTSIHTNTVESTFSLLKRGLIGSFHRVSIKHLHRYLTEFEYRFNARKAADRFNMTLSNMLGDTPMPYADFDGGGVAGIIFPAFPCVFIPAFGAGGACIILCSRESN